MIKRINLLVFQSLMIINCSCQTALNTSLRLNEYTGINDIHIEHLTIEYTNESKNDMLIWIDFSENKDENHFFRNRQDDFSLSDLLWLMKHKVILLEAKNYTSEIKKHYLEGYSIDVGIFLYFVK